VIEACDTQVSIDERSVNFDCNTSTCAGSTGLTRAIWKFDGVREVFIGRDQQKIVSATVQGLIRGQATGGWQDSALGLHVLNNNPCCDTATWDCRDKDETGCCVTWRMLQHGPEIVPDFQCDPVGVKNISLTSIPTTQGWLQWDVLDDIENFRDNSFLDSRSYLVKKECEADDGDICFLSCEGGQCPQLVIQLEAVCPPPPENPCH